MSGLSQHFWDFSVELYGQDGVSAACLELQNEFGFDVNLLLFCYWHGRCHGIIDDQLLQQAIKFSSNWRQSVVQPLRNVRKWMKVNATLFEPGQSSQFEVLRERIKEDELAAEKYQQEAMEKLVQSSTQAGVAGMNSSDLDLAKKSLKAARINLEKLLAAMAEGSEIKGSEIKEAIEPKLSVISTAFYTES